MRNYLLLFLLLAFINQLSYAQKGFEILGQIIGAKNGSKVYLTNLDESSTDSAKITNEKFSFKGKVKQPSGGWITYGDEYTKIMIENTRMIYKSSIGKITYYADIKGGNEQQLSSKLGRVENPFYIKAEIATDSLRNKYYSSDVHKKQLIQRIDSFYDSAQKAYVDFGKSNPNSFLGLDILYRNRTKIGKDTIRELISKMSSKVKMSAKGKALQFFANEKLVSVGDQFIDFTARTLDDIPFKLSSLSGYEILLIIWDPNCVPCRYLNQFIFKNYNSFKNKIKVVSFNIGVRKDDWDLISKKSNIAWYNVSDLKGIASEVKAAYNVQATPTSFLINKEGKVVKIFDGYDDEIENYLKFVSKK